MPRGLNGLMDVATILLSDEKAETSVEGDRADHLQSDGDNDTSSVINTITAGSDTLTATDHYSGTITTDSDTLTAIDCNSVIFSLARVGVNPLFLLTTITVIIMRSKCPHRSPFVFKASRRGPVGPIHANELNTRLVKRAQHARSMPGKLVKRV